MPAGLLILSPAAVVPRHAAFAACHDAIRCSRVTSDALQKLLEGCKQLHRLVLPLPLQLPAVLVGRAHSLEVDEEEERQVLLLDKDHTV